MRGYITTESEHTRFEPKMASVVHNDHGSQTASLIFCINECKYALISLETYSIPSRSMRESTSI